MPPSKGQFKGIRHGGRQKGTPNKVTSTVKDNVLAVFKKLGGAEAMANWARDNPTHFYQLYAKLIPQDVHKTVEHRVPTKITFNAIDMSGGKQVEYVNSEDIIDSEIEEEARNV